MPPFPKFPEVKYRRGDPGALLVLIFMLMFVFPLYIALFLLWLAGWAITTVVEVASQARKAKA